MVDIGANFSSYNSENSSSPYSYTGRETIDEHEENQLVELLHHHYGDGVVYLPAGQSKQLLVAAKNLGYISEDGYLTRQGRILLATNSSRR